MISNNQIARLSTDALFMLQRALVAELLERRERSRTMSTLVAVMKELAQR